MVSEVEICCRPSCCGVALIAWMRTVMVLWVALSCNACWNAPGPSWHKPSALGLVKMELVGWWRAKGWVGWRWYFWWRWSWLVGWWRVGLGWVGWRLYKSHKSDDVFQKVGVWWCMVSYGMLTHCFPLARFEFTWIHWNLKWNFNSSTLQIKHQDCEVASVFLPFWCRMTVWTPLCPPL